MKYYLYGMIVESDLDFMQLVKCEEEKAADITIMEKPLAESLEEKKESSKVMYEIGMEYSWLVNKTCYLEICNGHQIFYEKKENGREDYLRTYILGYGMSMLAFQKKIVAMHCSALSDEKGALLVVGESGSGKSTVATAFLEAGYRLMADDMAFVKTNEQKESIAYPAFPYQKLCRNVAEDKGYELEEMIYIDEDKDKFLAPYKGPFSLEGVKVKGLLMLQKIGGDEVVAKKLVGMDTFSVCSNNLFLRHLLGDQKYAPEIGRLSLALAASFPVYYIGRPDGKDTSQEVIARAMEFAKDM